MKRVTKVNRSCVLFATSVVLALGACVEEGPKAPPLFGQLGPVQPPPPPDGGAGMAGAAGSSGAGGDSGAGGEGGSSTAGSSGAAGTATLPDAGTPDTGSDAG